MTSQTKDDVHKFIVDILQEMSYELSDLSGDMALGPSGLDLESLTVAELGVRLQDAYGVQIQEDDFERVMTLTLDEFAAEVASRSTATETQGAL